MSHEDDSARRYPIVYSRPPGGGHPYLGAPKRLRKLNDAAPRAVGFNVSGTTHPGRGHCGRCA
ncbi:MAG: hypothetical protein R3B07_16345 [Polyangiaceae bacterium]